jgi:hypothetical protein
VQGLLRELKSDRRVPSKVRLKADTTTV